MSKIKKYILMIIITMASLILFTNTKALATDFKDIGGETISIGMSTMTATDDIYCIAHSKGLYRTNFETIAIAEITGPKAKFTYVEDKKVKTKEVEDHSNAIMASILGGKLEKGYGSYNESSQISTYNEAQEALYGYWNTWVLKVAGDFGFQKDTSNDDYDNTESLQKAKNDAVTNNYKVTIYLLKQKGATNYQELIGVKVGEAPTPYEPGPEPSKTEVTGYININGYVWEDVANTKDYSVNSKYSQDDKDLRIEGIKVHWKASDGSEIATTTTDKNGEYKLTTTIALYNHPYGIKDKTKYEKINNSYIEFEYNGLKYTTVAYNENLSATDTSKGKEDTNKRASLDAKFDRAENQAVYDGNRAIITGLPNTKISDANYTSELAVSASTLNIAKELMEASENNNWTEKKDFCIEHCQVNEGPHVLYKETYGNSYIKIYCNGQVEISDVDGHWSEEYKTKTIIEKKDKIIGDAINTAQGSESHYYSAGETGKPTYRDCRKSSKEIYIWNIKNMNLGLVRREQPDAALVSDIEKVRVIEPNMNQVGAQEYTYIYGNRNISNSTDNELYNYKVQFGNKYMQTYTRPISPSDIAFINYNKTEQLKVYVTYDIKIKNQSTTLPMKINSIVNYYDSDYTINKGDNTSSGWQDTNQVIEKVIPIENENDKETKRFKMATNPVNITLQPGTTSDVIRIEFEVSQDKIKELQNTDTGFRFTNYTEITSYTTFYGDNTKCAELQLAKKCGQSGKQYAGIDSDSTPGNLDISDLNTFEDDTDRAPAFKLVKDSNYRQISGIVYEDTQTAESKNDNERLGNGQKEGNEKGVQGVKVELYDATTGQPAYLYYIDTNGSNRKPAVAYTNANGEYTFGDDGKSGVVVGNYFIKYTYGNADGVQTTIDGSSMVNARNYKSTIVTDSIVKDLMTGNRNDDRWYLDMDQDKATSIAVDDMQERLAQEELKYSTYKNAYNMSASSKAFTIKMEYTKANQANVDINGGNLAHTWKAFSFGMIERPREDLVINKTISKVQVILGNGQTLIDGDPRNGKLNYVKGIGLGKEADRTAIFNANQNARRALSIEMDQELIQGSTLKVWYLITLTNNSEKDYDYETNTDYYYYGTNKQGEALALADIVVDYMSSAMQCNVGSQFTESEAAIAGDVNNADWFKYVNGNVATDAEFLKNNGFVSYKLSDEEEDQAYETIVNKNLQSMVTNTFAGLKPGETKSSVIYASKILANSDNNAFDNHVEVIQRNAKTGRTIKGVEDNTRKQLEDEMYQPGNYQPSLQSTGYKHEQDDDTVNVTITPPTGIKNYTTIYIISATVGLVVIAGVIVLIKKRFMKD